MESGILKIMKWRPSPQKIKILVSTRPYSDLPNLRKEQEKRVATSEMYPNLLPQYWSERHALKKNRREHSFPHSVKSSTDFLQYMQNLKNFPKNFKELCDFFIRRQNRRDLINQQFLAQRELVLKPDLAAAHFIVNRGGSVRFVGHTYWIGFRENKQSLPFTYVPAFHIEAINAKGTRLCYEGLENLRKLQYIKYLSLSDLDGVNDWCLDWVSKEFYATLKHLDLTNCKNVTYRGLSCFYRFECLKTLNLEGVPDTPEMKLACLMLLEVMPNLIIKGIDLDVPDKIDPVEETKHLSEKARLISEGTKLEETKQDSKM